MADPAAALAASALTALVIGVFVVRTSGVYFIMVTLAFAQMVYYFFHDTPRRRRVRRDVRQHAAGDSVVAGLDLADDLHFYYVVLALLAGAFAAAGADPALALRPRACRASRPTSSACARSASQRWRYKLAAFVLAGTLAGLAGYLAAAKEGYVNPELLAWHQSGMVLMMLILGGMGTLFGAVIGTFSYVLLQEWFSDADQALAAADGRLHHRHGAAFPQGLPAC